MTSEWLYVFEQVIKNRKKSCLHLKLSRAETISWFGSSIRRAGMMKIAELQSGENRLPTSQTSPSLRTRAGWGT